MQTFVHVGRICHLKVIIPALCLFFSLFQILQKGTPVNLNDPVSYNYYDRLLLN